MYGCEFNAKETTKKIAHILLHWFAHDMGDPYGVVIGLSGGKDSAVAAALCCMAFGRSNVLGVLMPDIKRNEYNVTDPVNPDDFTDAEKDAMELAEHLGIDTLVVPIGNVVSEMTSNLLCYQKCVDANTINNIKARTRMMTLYAIAQERHLRVCCTSNASEIYLGYSTKYGDFAGDFAPLSHLTKTQVVEVGRCLELPEHLIEKAPSDGMCGKTDEDAFGFTYMDLDFYLTNGHHPNPDVVEKIECRHRHNLHKSLPMLHIEV